MQLPCVEFLCLLSPEVKLSLSQCDLQLMPSRLLLDPTVLQMIESDMYCIFNPQRAGAARVTVVAVSVCVSVCVCVCLSVTTLVVAWYMYTSTLKLRYN